MIFNNILLVGFYVSFIFIFLYSYWGYFIYRKSSTRIGMMAKDKYYKEMTEADPSKIGYEPKPASVSVVSDPGKSLATVKFNIYNNSKPAVPVGGAIRTYNLYDSQDRCLSTTTRRRKPQADCQGLLSDIKLRECTVEVTGALGCLWV